MKRTAIFAVALALLGITHRASAAEMTLVRNSRPVTAAEVSGGAPSGGMVHDLYATSDADLLSLATHFSQSAYQHPYGSDNDAPPSELIAYFPALAADSFLRLPSSTIVLGGGFNEADTEKAWGDVSNDGPQSSFLFGRLTTTEPGSFAGHFAVRGQETYIEMPFSFTLPGPLGLLTEMILVSGVEEQQAAYTPPAAPLPTGERTLAPEPRHLKPSPTEQLTSWMISLPLLPPPPTNDILAFKATIAQRRATARTLAAIPEPATSILFAVALPLWVRRRAP